MSQPPAYLRQFSFTNFSALNPTTPQPGVQLDAEFNKIKATTDAIGANLALIQRDDGSLANVTVGLAQLKPEMLVGIKVPKTWVTGFHYLPNDVVWQSNVLYRCLVDHFSGVFATDLGAGDWQDWLDYTDPLGAAAASASAAAISATSAGTSATASAASATDADASATDAAASAAIAATYAGALPLPIPVASGGSGAVTAAGARTAFGLVIGTNVQAYSTLLASMAALPTAADFVPYFTGVNTLGAAAFTPFARTLVAGGDAATMRATLGVRPGTDVQLQSPVLSLFAALNVNTDTIGYFNTGASMASTPFPAFGRTLVSQTSAGAAVNTLGLGNVENKSSATIRGELTHANVNTAIGKPAAYVASGAGGNTGRISWGTGAPGTLDEGEVYLQYT